MGTIGPIEDIDPVDIGGFDAVLAAALSSIPPAVVVFDDHGRPVWANASMRRLLGASADLEKAFPASDQVRGDAVTAALDGSEARLDRVLITAADGVVAREAWTGPLEVAGATRGAVLVVPAEEERLHPLLANTHDIISVLGADGTIRYSNPAAGRLMAYEDAVLAGTNALDLVHPDDQRLVLELLDDPAQADEAIQLRLRFGDGEWHHCLVHIADLLDDPSVGGIVVTVHDITEQTLAHDELARSERWVRQLLARLTDVVVVFDATGKLTYVSPSIEQLVGLPESVHPGTSAFSDVHPDDAANVEAALRALDADPDTEQRITFRLRHADGHWIWVEAVASNCLDDPAVEGVVTTLRDVTELKQAEQMFRSFVDSAPDATVIVDGTGAIALANERAETLFDGPADELVGQQVEVLIPEQLRSRHVGHREGYAENPHSRMMGEGLELVARRRDGTEFPVEVSLSPHDTHRGRLISAAVRDITVQRQNRIALEAALENEQAMVRKLEEADQRKAEFVSTVAHELRNPLTAISGFASLLERMLEDDDQRADGHMMASRITANAGRLLEMIEQLLRFSRLEAGRARLDRRVIGVGDVVERSLDLLRETLDDHHVDVVVPDDLTIWADEDGVANVLRNLLSNAAKFGPSGTTIRIEAGATEDSVVVSVTDEGPGIPPDERDAVFDQFRQTETGKRKGGTGLGLDIARRYVQLHGGDIWVDEGPEGGACFTFRLPQGE